jgi:hypothetical protein
MKNINFENYLNKNGKMQIENELTSNFSLIIQDLTRNINKTLYL